MPIHPLPQFEADLAEHLKEKADREAYERLNAPSSIVVRFGYLKMVGEFPYKGDAKPGCGSKLVVRTHRGTEIGEMLTSTCPNSGCSKSVSRKEMLEYIENSGGKQYPFHDRGRVLRIATVDDLGAQEQLEQRKNELRMLAKRLVERAKLPMKIIEAEPLLGGERTVVYFSADDRVDFRDLVQEMQRAMGGKVELRQIGARDEARITADYERCGQYCCCKNFLKVLKPVSMKSAKVQKATLDPLKISGRCGRLMCCLRYEDETYEQLRKNLPHRKSRVGTPDGDGMVISTQILTQLALIKLDSGTEAAYPIENLTEPASKTAPEVGAKPKSPGRRGEKGAESRGGETRGESKRGGGKRRRRGGADSASEGRSESRETAGDSEPSVQGGAVKKKKRRRRKRSGSPSDTGTNSGKTQVPSDQAGGVSEDRGGPGSEGPGEGADRTKKKRKRRRRRRPSSGGGEGGSTGGGGGDAS